MLICHCGLSLWVRDIVNNSRWYQRNGPVLSLGFVIDCGGTRCFRSQDIVTQTSDGEKINYNTIQINEQLNVSTPQRAVIVRCSLIEGAEGEQDVVPTGRCGRRGCALLCPAALRKLIIHLEPAEAKQNLYKRLTAYCTCTCTRTQTLTLYVWMGLILIGWEHSEQISRMRMVITSPLTRAESFSHI